MYYCWFKKNKLKTKQNKKENKQTEKKSSINYLHLANNLYEGQIVLQKYSESSKVSPCQRLILEEPRAAFDEKSKYLVQSVSRETMGADIILFIIWHLAI